MRTNRGKRGLALLLAMCLTVGIASAARPLDLTEETPEEVAPMGETPAVTTPAKEIASPLSIEDGVNTWYATLHGIEGESESPNYGSVVAQTTNELSVETDVSGVKLFLGGAWRDGGSNQYHLEGSLLGVTCLAGTLAARKADGLTNVTAKDPVPETGTYYRWEIEADGVLEVQGLTTNRDKALLVTRNGELVTPDYCTENSVDIVLKKLGLTVSAGDVITVAIAGGIFNLSRFAFTPSHGETVQTKDVPWTVEHICEGNPFRLDISCGENYVNAQINGPFVGWRLDTTDGLSYQHYADEVVLECYNSKGELVLARASTLTTTGRDHHLSVELSASGNYTFKALAKRAGEAAPLESNTVTVDCTFPLKEPELFTVSSVGGGAMEVRWYKTLGADSYNVYYSMTGEEWTQANAAPIPAENKSILSHTIPGLEVGISYAFKVEALQSATGLSADSAMVAVVKQNAEPGWVFRNFGESTYYNHHYGDLNNDGRVQLVAGTSSTGGSKGGKLIPKKGTDGIGFYYTPVPAGTNWTLRAKVHVNQWCNDQSGQSGVGIGVYDRVPNEHVITKYWNNSFIAAAAQYTHEGRRMNLATISDARYGVPQSHSDVTSTPDTFTYHISPLDQRILQDPDLPYTRCNTIGNRVLASVEQDTEGYYENPEYMYTDLIFEVQKNNTGYIARQYDAETGELIRENIEYFVNGVHEMSGTDVDARSEVSEPTHATALDPDYEYVGLFTARYMDATFSDVTLTTIPAEEDEPAVRPPLADAVTHTATFMVGDKVIDKIVFDQGAATLSEPALPVRENYVGAWEPYDLAAATGDITIQGHYTPIDPDKTSDLEAGAEATYENGIATITLNASAASKTIKVMTETVAPADVVLVLDQSGSMQETLSRKDRQSKRDALVDCAERFVQSLYDNAEKTGADHRVAVVGFSCEKYNQGKPLNLEGYNNTGLLATPSGKSKNYKDLRDADYQTALLPIRSGNAINPNVTAGLQSVVAEGATAADVGLSMAKSIFAENPTSGTDRQRVVIFITDGTPTAWHDTPSLIKPTAANAISAADHIKNGQDAKIYSVGVHADADATAAFTNAKDGVSTDYWGGYLSYDFNRFLHAVSSNYPNAQSMSNLGEGDKAGGYYMAVTDTSNLQSIFNNILYNTVYELKRFDKVTLHYTLPATFALTIEQEMDLRQTLRDQYGITDADILVARNGDGTTTLRLRNIPTQETYDDSGVLIYQATVSFQASANQLASGATSAGSGGAGYGEVISTEFEAPAVTVPADRKLLVFTIGSQVYQIKEAHLGDAVVVPESRLAIWELEDPNTKVTGDYAVFSATSRGDVSYAVNWIMGDTRVLQYYRFGEAVTPPNAADYAPEGYEFSGWSSNLPATMPPYDVTCTAIYSPAHVHSFAKAYQTGTCAEGVVTVYRCPCGAEKSEQAQIEPHNYNTVFSDNGSAGNTISKLVCTKCGDSQEQNITFKVAYSKGWETTVLDLSLYQREVNITEPDEDVEIRFYIGEDDGRTYTITRIDADGKRTRYRGKAQDGYLVFKVDHFSIYVVGDAGEASGTDQVSYQHALDILDNKVELTADVPPEGHAPLTGTLGNDQEFTWNVENDNVLTLTAAQGVIPASGDTVFVATWDKNGRFLSAQLHDLSAGSATATLPRDWRMMKLIWTDQLQTPYCPAVRVNKS